MTVASLAGGVTGLSARWLLMAVERAQSVAAVVVGIDRDAFVARLFEQEGASLVRMARLFTDDRNAAEDLVQEAFIRLHKSAHRIRSPEKAAPYLRSIVINLTRDHNRRGLMSLRHQEATPAGTDPDAPEDRLLLDEEQTQRARQVAKGEVQVMQPAKPGGLAEEIKLPPPVVPAPVRPVTPATPQRR